MGLAIGVILSFIGVGLLLGPLIIDASQSRKDSNKEYKRELEAAAWLVGIASIFLIGGVLVIAFTSGSKVVSSGIEGYTGKKPDSNIVGLLKIKRERDLRLRQRESLLSRERLARESLLSRERREVPVYSDQPIEPFYEPYPRGGVEVRAEPHLSGSD